MKKFGMLLLTGFLILLISGCSENGMLTPDDPAEATFKGAKKPVPRLIGEQVCTVNPDGPLLFECYIDFGDFGEYSITFIPHGPPRDYSQANVFEEDMIIYYKDSDWTNPENIVMTGFVKGTHTLANRPPDPTKFISNGKVLQAYGPLEMWKGRKIHSQGTFYWTPEGAPDWLECSFTIN